MHRINVIIYFLLNGIWSLSIIFWALSFSVKFDQVENLHLTISYFCMLLLAIFQLMGAYKIWNKSYDIPILATFLFLIQIDISGFKFIPQTLTNLYVRFEPYKLIIDGLLIDDPTVLINLSFSDFQFQSIAINLVVLIQLALLIWHDYNITHSESSD